MISRNGLNLCINTCRFIDVRKASALYRLLGDEARLRLLRVLSRERLNVTELTGILGLAQSGVSRHLGLLKEAGLVAEERDGGFSYYRLAAGLEPAGAHTLTPMPGRTPATRASWCRGGAGPRGRARSGFSCRRSPSPISAVAKAISRSKRRAGRPESLPSTAPGSSSDAPARWRGGAECAT